MTDMPTHLQIFTYLWLLNIQKIAPFLFINATQTFFFRNINHRHTDLSWSSWVGLPFVSNISRYQSVSLSNM